MSIISHNAFEYYHSYGIWIVNIMKVSFWQHVESIQSCNVLCDYYVRCCNNVLLIKVVQDKVFNVCSVKHNDLSIITDCGRATRKIDPQQTYFLHYIVWYFLFVNLLL